MPSENEHDIVNELSKLLLDIMMLIHPPDLPARYASIDSLQTLHTNLISLRDFLFAASNGDLSKRVPCKGFIGGTLKSLQANLRHLTWQTKMVASGDFTQRVEFMGEFSHSFNTMVVKLDQTLKDLVEKETELMQTNEELLKEISIRKQTETALRKSEETLRLLAITDSLTDLYNRRYFYELAEIEISKSIRYSRPLSVMMFDLDFFKHINDTFGHTTGDMVLKTVAEITKELLRKSDIIARYGGEEFVVLLPETSAPEASAISERMRKQIENTTIEAGNRQITVTVSFGVSDFLRKTNSETQEIILSEFISSADQALYASKNTGRNKVTVYKRNLRFPLDKTYHGCP
jgi:diguanylate cyclase (GGDEF)-like protein